jgi:hypothetical protein
MPRRVFQVAPLVPPHRFYAYPSGDKGRTGGKHFRCSFRPERWHSPFCRRPQHRLSSLYGQFESRIDRGMVLAVEGTLASAALLFETARETGACGQNTSKGLSPLANQSCRRAAIFK